MFVYRPHIHALDDVVTTPDLIVESWRDAAGPQPVSALRCASQADVAQGIVAAALILVAGSYGTVATIGLEFRSAAAPGTVALALIAREAWRYADIEPHLARLQLVLEAPDGAVRRAALAAPPRRPGRGELLSHTAAALTAPVSSGRIAAAALDDSAGRGLHWRIAARLVA